MFKIRNIQTNYLDNCFCLFRLLFESISIDYKTLELNYFVFKAFFIFVRHPQEIFDYWVYLFEINPILCLEKSKELDAIRSMVRHDRCKCLQHPVVVKFLDSKWNRSTARICHFVNLVLYATFLFSMTTYIGLQMEGNL